MQEIHSTTGSTPTWGLLLLILLGFGFLLGLLFRPRSHAGTGSRQSMSGIGWFLLAIGGLFLGFFFVGVKSYSMHGTRSVQIATEVRHDRDLKIAQMEQTIREEAARKAAGLPPLPRENNSIAWPNIPAPSPAAEAQASKSAPTESTRHVIEQERPTSPTDSAPARMERIEQPSITWKTDPFFSPISNFRFHWPAITHFGVGPAELLILLVVGGFLISRFRITSQTPTPVELPHVDRPVRYGWLIVPVLCFAGLGYIAMPAFFPAPNVDADRLANGFANRQQRMEKVVGELLESSGRPGPDIQNVPDWLRNYSTRDLSKKDGEILLTSEQYSSRKEAEDELLPFAAYLLQRTFQENHPWQGAWNVPLAQVRERVVQQQFVERRTKQIGKFSGEIYRLHMLVNVSPTVAESFTEEWKSQIVRHRLQVLGVLLGWLTCLLMTGSAYFRRATHPENSVGWMHHLKMSGVTIGLTAAAAWVLVGYIG